MQLKRHLQTLQLALSCLLLLKSWGLWLWLSNEIISLSLGIIAQDVMLCVKWVHHQYTCTALQRVIVGQVLQSMAGWDQPHGNSDALHSVAQDMLGQQQAAIAPLGTHQLDTGTGQHRK